MTSSSWSVELAMTQKHYAMKLRQCLQLWACACRRARRRYATWMKDSTSWAGASSAGCNEVEVGSDSLHLSIKAVIDLGDGEGAITHPSQETSDTRHLVAGGQPCASRMVQLLQAWCFVSNVQLHCHFSWTRIVGWLRKRHLKLNWGTLRRRFLPAWEIRDGETELFRPESIAIERYRYRGARILTPVDDSSETIRPNSGVNAWRAGCGGSRTSGSEGGPEKRTGRNADKALRSDPYTYVPTWAGFLYVAVVLDVCSRRVVGWAMSENLRTELVLNALDMAVWNRRRWAVWSITATRVVPYTSFAFGRRCREAGVVPSMGSVGDCFDNAMAETSSPPWSASCSTARHSATAPKLGSPSSITSRASTTPAVFTPPSAI